MGSQLPAPYCSPRKRKTSCRAKLNFPSSSFLSRLSVLSWVLVILLVQTSTTAWSVSPRRDARSRPLSAINLCRFPCKTLARAFDEILYHISTCASAMRVPQTNLSRKAERTTTGRLQREISWPLQGDGHHRVCGVSLRLESAV
jgi:hypothetical protein